VSRLWLVVCGLVLGFVVSCAPSSKNQIDGRHRTGIINGSDVKEGDPIEASIVAIYNVQEKYLCTGSLITPNVVMTAAHCIGQQATDLRILFTNDIDHTTADHVLRATDARTNPRWKVHHQDQENTGDIALIKFSGTLPAGYKPANFLSNNSILKAGTTVTMAGFGVSKVTVTPVDPKQTPDLDKQIQDGEVDCDEAKNECIRIESSGDGILRQTTAPIEAVRETEVVLDETHAGTCSGDSGGPAYIAQNGQYFLFGVTSRGGAACNDNGIYTNALTYARWIQDTIRTLR